MCSMVKYEQTGIATLLSRPPRHILTEETKAYYKGKVILVTGGGGSIGGALCRVLADCDPARLIVVDIGENGAYMLQQELLGRGKSLTVEIASVRDRDKLNSLFERYRPQIVFHAAAHKHVPLMERCPDEAVKNNVMGTCNVADLCEAYGAEKCILISTDKAVHPTSIMGATKRMCEWILQSRRDSHTCFAAVRFGNVLDSNGSVVPLFRQQIEAGGPITLTDKRITRYLMLIPEAVQLVMTAGAMAHIGDLFVLDMGEPVSILALAEGLIRQYGLEPYTDIDIREIGLRPGEKLYEELFLYQGSMEQTANPRIYREIGSTPNREAVAEKLRILQEAVAAGDADTVRDALHRVIPDYRYDKDNMDMD